MLINSRAIRDAGALAFYCQALTHLRDSKIPFLVGGSYALNHSTGIARIPKDLDIFVHPRDCDRLLQRLTAAGYQTELVFPHWLGKAGCGAYLIDVIFNSGNGLCPVDDEWFEHAPEAEVLGTSVRLCPPEETIWQQAFIAERERYDGADVAHMLKTYGETLAWPRLLRRFDRHWRVLMSHIVLFGFIYPSERGRIPAWVMNHLIERLQEETCSVPRSERLCQGTLLSRGQYLVDIMQWKYEDVRLRPRGALSSEYVALWTTAIEDG